VLLLDPTVVINIPSPADDGMSVGDGISLLSAIIRAVGVWQFRVGLSLDRKKRNDDATELQRQRLQDASEVRRQRQEDDQAERETRQEEARKAWLTNVILQPKLNTINSFYTDNISYLLAALNSLIITSAANPQLLDVEKDKHVGYVNNSKQQFDYAFVSLIEGQNRRFGQKLRDLLNELEDIMTNPIGALDYSTIDLQVLEREIYEHKSKFFTLLYQELQQATV
jgi:hypothetical protein